MTRDVHQKYDSVFVHARRETIVLLIAFFVFLVWTIGVSYSMGYGQTEAETRRTVLGIPAWAFWGVVVPWLAADIFTFWFCLVYMEDDPLGEELDDGVTQTKRGESS